MDFSHLKFQFYSPPRCFLPAYWVFFRKSTVRTMCYPSKAGGGDKKSWKKAFPREAALFVACQGNSTSTLPYCNSDSDHARPKETLAKEAWGSFSCTQNKYPNSSNLKSLPTKYHFTFLILERKRIRDFSAYRRALEFILPSWEKKYLYIEIYIYGLLFCFCFNFKF